MLKETNLTFNRLKFHAGIRKIRREDEYLEFFMLLFVRTAQIHLAFLPNTTIWTSSFTALL